MPRREQEEPYFDRLATHMVREDRDMFQAATDLELGLNGEDCKRLAKNKAFQRALRSARMQLFNELADDPKRGKNTLIGQAIFSIERLLDVGQYDKALAGILTLAKIEGFVGADSNVNVFAGLSTKDLQELKTKLKQGQNTTVELPEAKGNA